jgi:Ca-activated chloride channel family protein
MKLRFFFFILIIMSASLWANSKADLSLDFEEAMDNEDYNQADNLLQELQQRTGENTSKTQYNQGVLQYRKGEYDQAAESFLHAQDLSSSDKFKSQSAYNRANSLYEQYHQDTEAEGAQNLLGQALQSYRDALQWNPENENAAHNLERILLQEPPPDENDSSSSQDQQNDNQDNQQTQDQQNDNQNNQQSQENPQDSNSQEMTPEQLAKQILQQEEQQQEERDLSDPMEGVYYEVEQDW